MIFLDFFATLFSFWSEVYGALNTVKVADVAPVGMVLLSGAVLSICIAAFWVGRGA